MKIDSNIVLIRQGAHRNKLGVYIEDSDKDAVVLIGDPRETTHRIIIKHEHLIDVSVNPKLIQYLLSEIIN